MVLRCADNEAMYSAIHSYTAQLTNNEWIPQTTVDSAITIKYYLNNVKEQIKYLQVIFNRDKN